MGLLRQTGALREGHFECLNGLHTNKYLDIALAMRNFAIAKVLSVGLSRRLREHHDLRAMASELSIVAATTGGLPIAFGLCEALRARQVYWAERGESGVLRFRQYLEQTPGEKVVLVDDILRAGRVLGETRTLLEANGAHVLAIAVAVHQPTPRTADFGTLPVYSLAKLQASYYADPGLCDLCRAGVPLVRTGPAAAAVAA